MSASPERLRLRARVVAGAASLALILTACSGNVDLDTESPEPGPSTTSAAPEEPRPVAESHAPDAAHTLLPAQDAADIAVGVSRTYLTAAQVAILAPQGDRAAVLRAASLGAATGAPVLLSDGPVGALDTELLRLGVIGVVTVGAVDLDQVDTTALAVAPAPEDPRDLGEIFGVSLTDVDLPEEGADDVAALLALEPGQVFAAADPAASPSPSETSTATDSGGEEPTAVGELPPLAPAVPLEASALIADGDPAQLAGLGTAIGLGAQVLEVAGDVRGDPEAITALAEAQPSNVLGIGTSLGTDAEFAWRTATAQTGQQLPGGGQLVFDAKRYIALYGSPVTPALGVLGEQGTDETITLAASYAAEYDDLTEDTVVPALEIIVTVASGSAGDDGNYSNEWPSDTFLPLIEAAAEAGQYVVLDFQPGRTPFLEQVQQYEDLLAYPNVGIALDPEWRLSDDQVHLQQIGSVGIDEVNEVVGYLADLVQERLLPQKVIVLHQFQLRMITDRQDLDTSRSEVALLIHADGLGTQGAKQATWRTLHENAPEGIGWGWKNFIDEDEPMLSPKETYADVDPVPDFVSYQ